jgi:hypothetical protein
MAPYEDQMANEMNQTTFSAIMKEIHEEES